MFKVTLTDFGKVSYLDAHKRKKEKGTGKDEVFVKIKEEQPGDVKVEFEDGEKPESE